METVMYFTAMSTNERAREEAAQSIGIEPWKLLVIKESQDLEANIQKLRDFLIHHEEGIIREQGTTMWTVMRAQLHAMQTYNDCLIARIQGWSAPK